MTQLTCTGAGRSAAAAGYTFPLLTLFGEVERLAASGDYSVTCGTGAETLPVEFVNLAGNQTIAADTNWGNATADQRLLAVRVRGNLTIDATKTLTAAARKLGLLIFCDGDVTVNGTLSMTARGANHSATGSNLTAFDIMLYEVSAAADNIWPAAGASGAPNQIVSGFTDGSAGVNGQSGGGGAGGRWAAGVAIAGADGTAYGGGPGGGGAVRVNSDGGNARGGAGGAGNCVDITRFAGGGAGNPGGAGYSGGIAGTDGTGGVVLVLAQSISVSATGVISANGSAGGDGIGGAGEGCGGSGSGAGACGIYYQSAYSNLGTVQANGGAGGIGTNANGGAGGAGSIRAVAL